MNIEITEIPDEDEPPKTESLNEELWGLYFTRPDCEEEKYVHAFSFNKEILEHMIATQVPENEKSYYSIDPIKMYIYISVAHFGKNVKEKNKMLLATTIPGTHIMHIHGMLNVVDMDNLTYKQLPGLIYGFNYTRHNSSICEQILLCTDEKTTYMETAGISSIPIQIDTFYEESILNA